MTDTWGIPGPVFAGGYLGLLLLAALFAVVRAALLVHGHAGGAPERPEELALLTGGRARVGEFVVATLLDRQLIRMDGTGRLYRVKGTAPDDLGRAALLRIGKTGTAVDRVREQVEHHPAVTELERGLISRGLLADPRKRRLTWVFTAVAYAVLGVLGVVRLIAGSASGHAVGYLGAMLILATLAAVFATVRATNATQVKPTAAGRAAVEEARRAGTLVAGPAGAVAADGLGGHPDKDVRLAVSRATQRSTVRYPRHRARWANAGGGAAVGYYGGSSCGGGGGSSCGGGGGGCGGGGGGGGGCGG
jgi:uncharacterized protein (TIGR04222 family)